MQTTQEQLQELAATIEAFAAHIPDIDKTGELLLNCLKGGHIIYTCGNGGSAADALHLSEELVGRYRDERPPLAACCLNADVTAVTCICNDYGYEQVFARQIQALGKPGDVLVGFSTSGKSPNVLRAFEKAHANGVTTILVGGKDGGPGKDLAQHSIIVPSDNTARIQELHTFVLHAWLEKIEAEYAK